MPFTPSHAAAALLFARTPLIPSAVVIGTMAPDVPYYLPVRVPRDLTHSLEGVVTIDLAVTVALVLLWFAVLRAPVVDLLPEVVRLRMPPAGPLGWRGDRRWRVAIPVLVLSALVGIATHLIWDSFTHDGWLVRVAPELAHRVGPLPVYSWLQHASTITGLLLLALWAVRWVQVTPAVADRSSGTPQWGRIAAWISVVLAFGASGLAVWLWLQFRGLGPFEPSVVFVGATVAGGVAVCTGVAICAVWWIARVRAPGSAS